MFQSLSSYKREKNSYIFCLFLLKLSLIAIASLYNSQRYSHWTNATIYRTTKVLIIAIYELSYSLLVSSLMMLSSLRAVIIVPL